MATELLRRDQPFVLRQSRPDLADDAAFLAFRQAHADLPDLVLDLAPIW